MNMRTMKRALLILTILLGLLAPNLRAQQAPQSALAVSPAIFEAVLDPGKTTKQKITVTNTANVPLPIKASVKSFTVNEEVASENRGIFDASTWFKVQEPDFILQPKQKREVHLTITPPTDAEPGGHYATVYFQPLLPAEVLSDTTAYLTARVGVLAFMIVKGDIIEQAKPAGPLSTAKIQQSGPINFRFKVKNEGNVHLLPTGRVTIYDWRNREVAKLPLAPTMILPKTQKELTVTWDKTRSFGLYHAKLDLVYGSEHKPLMFVPASFWVLPWTVGLGILFGGLMLFLALRYRRRLRRAWRELMGRSHKSAE